MAGVRIEVVGAEARRASAWWRHSPRTWSTGPSRTCRPRPGPFSFRTRFHCRAISSKAWSHETGWNSPSLANCPSFMRISGVREPVGAVHDLRQEVALDAVEAAVDLRLHVAVGRDDLSVLDADHDAAAGAAEAARRLGPFELDVRPGRQVLRRRGQAELAAAAAAAAAWALRNARRETSMAIIPASPRPRFRGGLEVVEDERGREHAVEERDLVQARDDVAPPTRSQG